MITIPHIFFTADRNTPFSDFSFFIFHAVFSEDGNFHFLNEKNRYLI